MKEKIIPGLTDVFIHDSAWAQKLKPVLEKVAHKVPLEIKVYPFIPMEIDDLVEFARIQGFNGDLFFFRAEDDCLARIVHFFKGESVAVVIIDIGHPTSFKQGVRVSDIVTTLVPKTDRLVDLCVFNGKQVCAQQENHS